MKDLCKEAFFIVIECKILITQKKNKQMCLLARQNRATFLFKFKFVKRETCKFFLALFLLLVGSGPKKSMPVEKLGSSSLVSSIF